MPWQECSKVDERLKFVARLLQGEKMAVLCREFDISRKTGHKIFNRYKDCGLEGLTDRSRRPYRQANRLPFQVENLILQLKKEHPTLLADKRYCYPLTITDFASRYLICCEALATTKAMYAFAVFERTFKDFGLPRAIRTDNGTPFASGGAFFGLTKLSVWWLRLGIGIERIKPGNPQQNGRHERMHLTLKKEATKPAAKNFLQQQQEKFDDFIQEFNYERPHQALNMKYSAELYTPSPRPYKGIGDVEYP
jgi:transposase InsO family protein